MDRWFLIAATLMALMGAVTGMWTVHRGTRSRWTVVWMWAAMAWQVGYLALRGEARGACPLVGLGEILAYLAWALTLFYLAVGPSYRLSLLGVFTAPVVVVFQGVALVPGMMEGEPRRVGTSGPWGETHAAMSVLGYGALALAAVAGVMFLVLDRQLKAHHLGSGLFRNLPPVRDLLKVEVRLLWMGVAMLSVGILAGFQMRGEKVWEGGDVMGHLLAAVGVWAAYVGVLGWRQWRGLTGKRTSVAAVVLFVASLSVFALI